MAAALPPLIDGIGDYTARLAAELADGNYGLRRVTVLAGDAAAAGADPIAGVAARGAFDPGRPASVGRLLDAIADDRPDWVVLQYNPFSFGRRGLNLLLPRAMAAVGRRSPGTRVAVMFHEAYVPAINWRFGVMAAYQRWQYWQLGRAADVLFFSMASYRAHGRRWFPGKPAVHLPVGSNLPRVPVHVDEARRRLGIGSDELVLGVFGMAHPSRPFSAVAAAAAALRLAGRQARILYIGGDGPALRAALAEADRANAITDGPLPADECSRRLSAVDVAFSTYIDGVSTRRGAMMAALQHGIATVGTVGVNTDPELRDLNAANALALVPAGDDAAVVAAVFHLADNPAERRRLADAGRRLFEERYSWPVIASSMLSSLARRPTLPILPSRGRSAISK